MRCRFFEIICEISYYYYWVKIVSKSYSNIFQFSQFYLGLFLTKSYELLLWHFYDFFFYVFWLNSFGHHALSLYGVWTVTFFH